MPLEFKAVHPLVSEAALVALLAPVEELLAGYQVVHSLIDYNDVLSNHSLKLIIQVEPVSPCGVEAAEVECVRAHVRLDFRHHAVHYVVSLEGSLGADGEADVAVDY